MTALHIEKLARQHQVDAFDCGVEPLNRFPVRCALQNQHTNASQTISARAINSDQAGRLLYRRFGFADGFSDPLHLYVLTKELKALLQ